MINQHLYWPGIIHSIQKEVTNCDTCQRLKLSNKKYGKLLAQLCEEIPWNKIYVDIIWPYVIRRKGWKEKLHIKSVTMIDPVNLWFEITQYNDKREISIANLVETTWLYRYPIPIEITYDQGSESIGCRFRTSLTET